MSFIYFLIDKWETLFSGIGTGLVIAIFPKIVSFIKIAINSLQTNGPIGKKWYGKMIQEGVSDNCVSTCTLDLSNFFIKGGRMEIHFPTHSDNEDSAHEFILKTKFFKNRLLHFDYKNKKNRIFQFGSVIFQVTSNGDKLYGTFSGYGPISEKPVNGTIELKRND